MIRFACPGCQATFTVDDSKAGKTGNCPKCQTQFIIPQPEPGGAGPAVGTTSAPMLNVPVSPPPPAANDPVEIDPCPKCQTRLSVSPADVGSDVECPYCKTVFRAVRPGGGRTPAPPPAPPKRGDADRPSRRRPDDEDDDRPRRRGRRDDDDVDEADRPARRGSGRRRDDDDEDDYEDRPRRRNRRRAGGAVVISRLGVLSTGKVLGVTYALISLIIAIPLGLIMMLAGAAGGGGPGGGGAGGILAGMGVCYIVMLPVIYGAAGFIGGIVFAAIYNLVAGWVGGMEMELDEM
jgi:hypothetical protein